MTWKYLHEMRCLFNPYDDIQTPEVRRQWIRLGTLVLTPSQKARELLFSFLTDEQQETYLDRNKGYIEVTSNLGRVWRIRNDTYSGNLFLMNQKDPNKVDARYCAHAMAYQRVVSLGRSRYQSLYPNDDHFLAQMFALMTNERYVTNTAYIQYRAQDATIPGFCNDTLTLIAQHTWDINA